MHEQTFYRFNPSLKKRQLTVMTQISFSKQLRVQSVIYRVNVPRRNFNFSTHLAGSGHGGHFPLLLTQSKRRSCWLHSPPPAANGLCWQLIWPRWARSFPLASAWLRRHRHLMVEIFAIRIWNSRECGGYERAF